MLRQSQLVLVDTCSVDSGSAHVQEEGGAPFEVKLATQEHVAADVFCETVAEYHELRTSYFARVEEHRSKMVDAITGNELKTDEHLIEINISTDTKTKDGIGVGGCVLWLPWDFSG